MSEKIPIGSRYNETGEMREAGQILLGVTLTFPINCYKEIITQAQQNEL